MNPMQRSPMQNDPDSPLTFSTWHGMRTRDPRRLILGSACWKHSNSEISTLLERAHEVEIQTLDTTSASRQIEPVLRSAIRSEQSWRILTPLRSEVHREGLGLSEVLENAAACLDGSRAALGIDALPTVLLSRFAHRHACGGRLWRWLLAERDAARIGRLGVCAATPEQAWAALEDPEIAVIRVATGLLDLRLYRQGFFPRARELGRTVYVHDTELQGVGLEAPETLPVELAGLGESVQTIQLLAAELGIPPRTLYLAFVRELPGVMPIVECGGLPRLEQLLSDWANPGVDGVHLARLVESLPILPDDLVDLARWSSAQLDLTVESNQTPATSIATIPT